MPPEQTDDQTETSSISTDETNGASSTTDKNGSSTDEKVLTLADVAKKAFEESSARNEPKGEKDASETEEPAQELGKSGEDDEDKGEEQQEEQPEVPAEEQEDDEDKEDDEKSPPPFDKHPRWVKRTQEFNEAKSKVTELDAKLKETEAVAQRWQDHVKFIEENDIPSQEVDQMMNFLAIVRRDPKQARRLLDPLLAQLDEVDDARMPADLIAAVKAGDVTQEMAERLWKAETQSKAGRMSGQFQAQRQARAAQAAKDQAIGAWDLAKRKADVDFKPKTPGAKDGLWEIVAKGWVYLKTMNPPQSPQDEVRLLEQAYTEAKEFVTPLRPPVTRKKPVLTSSRSSGAPSKTPKTLDDVVKGVAAGHGIAWNGRSNGSD